jgi:hypothetical protein
MLGNKYAFQTLDAEFCGSQPVIIEDRTRRREDDDTEGREED